jgi:hypothetical protein
MGYYTSCSDGHLAQLFEAALCSILRTLGHPVRTLHGIIRDRLWVTTKLWPRRSGGQPSVLDDLEGAWC